VKLHGKMLTFSIFVLFSFALCCTHSIVNTDIAGGVFDRLSDYCWKGYNSQ